MSNRKEVRITFVVDQASFNQAKNRINEIASSANKAMSSMANISGGLLSGATKGSAYHHSGRTSSQSNRNQTAGVSVNSALTKSISDQKAMLDSLSTSAASALKDMESVVRQSLRSQSSMLSDLRREIEGVSGAYSRMSGGISKGGFGGGGMGGGQYLRGGGGGGAAGGGGGGSSGSGTDAPRQRVMADEPMGKWASAIGRTAAGMAGMGGIVAGQVAGVSKEVPYYQDEMRAQFGGAINSRAMQMRGLTGEGFAYHMALQGSQARYQRSQTERQNDLSRMERNHQDNYKKMSTVERTQSELAIEAKRAEIGLFTRGGDTERTARETNTYLSTLPFVGSGGKGLGNLANAPGALFKGQYINHESVMKQMQMAELEMKSNPEWYSRYSEFMDTHDSRVGFQRAGGVGGQYRDPKTGQLRHRSLDLSAKLTGGGWNESSYVSGLQSIVPYGGFRAGQKGAWTAMAASQASHIPEAGKIMGAASQLGQDASGTLKALTGMGFGKKDRVDWQGMSNVGGFAADMAIAGGAPVDFQGTYKSFLGGMRPGMNSGQQINNIAGQIAGHQYLSNQIFGGGRDNLQKGQNYVNALDAFGNTDVANFIADNPYVMEMMIAARESGNIPPILKSMGVTSVAQIEKFVGETFKDGNRLLGANDFGQQSSMRDRQRKMVEGGYGMDFGKFAKDNNLQGEELDSFRNDAAAMLLANGFQKNQKEALGVVDRQIGLARPRDLDKGGFTDGMGRQERIAAKERGAYQGERAETQAGITGGDIKESVRSGKKFSYAGSDPNSGDMAAFGEWIGHFAKSTKTFDLAVDKLAAAIDKNPSTPNQAKPKK